MHLHIHYYHGIYIPTYPIFSVHQSEYTDLAEWHFINQYLSNWWEWWILDFYILYLTTYMKQKEPLCLPEIILHHWIWIFLIYQILFFILVHIRTYFYLHFGLVFHFLLVLFGLFTIFTITNIIWLRLSSSHVMVYVVLNGGIPVFLLHTFPLLII